MVALDAGNPMYVPVPAGHGVTARYARLNVISGTGAPVCVGEFRLFGPDQAAAGMERGVDLSFTPQELAAGARFTDRGVPGSPVSIMRQHGANYVRLRLWVNPPPGYNDLASDLAMARTVKAAGMKLYLDIMYSDFWADPQHQDTPAAWQGQDPQQLGATVQNYTHQVIAAFAAQRTPVDMVSIGNEIRNGILWPVGEVNWTANTGWDNLATLLKAGVAGARAGNAPGQQLDVMMHFDQGGDNQQSQVSPGYPASAGGQLSFVSDELSILAQVPDGPGTGLFYWAPEWIPGVGWEPGAGTPNDNLTLFDFQGGALPSVGSFQNPAAVCASYDPGNVPCRVG